MHNQHIGMSQQLRIQRLMRNKRQSCYNLSEGRFKIGQMSSRKLWRQYSMQDSIILIMFIHIQARRRTTLYKNTLAFQSTCRSSHSFYSFALFYNGISRLERVGGRGSLLQTQFARKDATWSGDRNHVFPEGTLTVVFETVY